MRLCPLLAALSVIFAASTAHAVPLRIVLARGIPIPEEDGGGTMLGPDGAGIAALTEEGTVIFKTGVSEGNARSATYVWADGIHTRLIAEGDELPESSNTFLWNLPVAGIGTLYPDHTGYGFYYTYSGEGAWRIHSSIGTEFLFSGDEPCAADVDDSITNGVSQPGPVDWDRAYFSTACASAMGWDPAGGFDSALDEGAPLPAWPDGGFDTTVERAQAVAASSGGVLMAITARCIEGDVDCAFPYRETGALLRVTDSRDTIVAYAGQEVAVGTETSMLGSVSHPAISSAGEVAFEGMIGNDTPAIFHWNGDAPRVVAYEGDGLVTKLHSHALIGSDGAVVFSADIDDGVERSCVLRDAGSGVEPVACEGDPVPDTPDAVYAGVGLPIINPDGLVAFSSSYEDATSSVNVVVREGSDGSHELVTRDGDEIVDGELSYTVLRPRAWGFNSSGDLLILANQTGFQEPGALLVTGTPGEVIVGDDPDLAVALTARVVPSDDDIVDDLLSDNPRQQSGVLFEAAVTNLGPNASHWSITFVAPPGVDPDPSVVSPCEHTVADNGDLVSVTCTFAELLPSGETLTVPFFTGLRIGGTYTGSVTLEYDEDTNPENDAAQATEELDAYTDLAVETTNAPGDSVDVTVSNLGPHVSTARLVVTGLAADPQSYWISVDVEGAQCSEQEAFESDPLFDCSIDSSMRARRLRSALA